ncbi:hypothetical protein BJ138DRAFT_1227043 [Hygrophoropsis aurantiaca]|uniref:Uncharacterized protein n=1 Tax=Hygrophoropsis aurantiaca TaxID=72124 RepID=A0ACB7ZXA9_9AGAM|nr:hypothetical protein BJ138DRAFT_1227043 [Hygrophoropsis aurantiaca]
MQSASQTLLDRISSRFPRLGAPIQIPGRNPILPPLFELASHEKYPNPAGKIFLQVIDGSAAGMEQVFSAAAQIEIPVGGPQSVKKMGFLLMRPGDVLMVRDVNGSGLEKDDKFKGGSISFGLQASLLERTCKVREEAIGSPELCTSEKAVKVDGEWCGGIYVERCHRSVNLGSGPRCYALGTTYEVQMSLHAPTVGNKLSTPYCDHLRLRSELLKVATEIAVSNIGVIPEDYRQAMEINSEIVNSPRLGCDDNTYFTSVQLNVASTVSAEQSLDLSNDLGDFGGKHIDSKDSKGGITAMVCMSKLPDTVHPGFFLLVESGVYWIMDPFTTFYFSGLHYHGGTPPTYPAELASSIPKDAYRLTLICYPSSSILDYPSRIALAALPAKTKQELPRIFDIVPEQAEVLISNQPIQPPDITHATYARDGLSIMAPISLLNFVVRWLLVMCIYIISQLPASMKVQVDRDKFIGAFSFHDRDRRVDATPWNLGPGHSMGDSNSDTHLDVGLHSADTAEPEVYIPFGNLRRFRGLQRYHAHREAVGQTIPVVVLEMDSGVLMKGGAAALKAIANAAKKGLPLRPREVPVQVEVKTSRGIKRKSTTAHSVNHKPKKKIRVEALNRASVSADYLVGIRRRVVKAARTPQRGKTRRKHGSDHDTQGTGRHRGLNSAGFSEATVRRSRRLSNKSKQLNNPNQQHGDHGATSTDEDPMEDDENIDPEDLPSVRSAGLAANSQSNSRLQIQPPVLPSSDAPVFLRSLTSKHIEITLENTKADLVAVTNIQSSSAVMAGIKLINQLVLGIKRNPLSADSALLISQFWNAQDIVRSHEAQINMTNHIHRQRLLISNMAAWTWLESACVKAAVSASQARQSGTTTLPDDISESNSWIAQLVNHVWELVTSGKRSAEISPKSFLPSINASPFAWKKSALVSSTDVELANQVCRTAHDIVKRWLGYPTDGNLEAQAWFVTRVCNTFGVNALLLEVTWTAAHNLRRDVLLLPPTMRWSALKEDNFDALEEALATHPLAQPDSSERKALNQIGDLYEQFRDIITKGTTSSALLVSLPLDSSNHLPDAACSDQTNVVTPALERSDPPYASSPGRPHCMLVMLQTLLPHIRQPPIALSPPPLPNKPSTRERAEHRALSNIFQKVNQLPEKYSPFRAHTPSVERLLGPDGPLTEKWAKTPEGLFSVLIFRLITFGTPFCLNRSLVFPSPQAFNDTLTEFLGGKDDTKKEVKKLYCDITIYGTPNPKRDRELVNGLWNAANKPENHPWLVSSISNTFTGVFDILSNNIFQVGPLLALLIAGDYACAGVIPAPTVREMGALVYRIQKGAFGGLKILGYLPNSQSKGNKRSASAASVNQEELECVNAFTALHDYLAQKFSSDDKALMGYSPIVLEHALCKLQRFSASSGTKAAWE